MKKEAIPTDGKLKGMHISSTEEWKVGWILLEGRVSL